MKFAENHVANAPVEWLLGLGFAALRELLPGRPISERISYNEVLLTADISARFGQDEAEA